MRRDLTSYVLVDQHMVDGVLIVKHPEEYRTRERDMHVDIDVEHRGGLYFDGEKFCFNLEEDDLLDDDDEVCMVDTIASPHQ